MQGRSIPAVFHEVTYNNYQGRIQKIQKELGGQNFFWQEQNIASYPQPMNILGLIEQ